LERGKSLVLQRFGLAGVSNRYRIKFSAFDTLQSATFSPTLNKIRLLCGGLRGRKLRQKMAQSHHCDKSVHLKRVFV
jgi:hypothetical protein